MWGTDWTRAVRILTYKQGVEVFRATNRLSESERTALMGGTLQQIYSLAVPDLVSSPPAALNDTRSGTLFAP